VSTELSQSRDRSLVVKISAAENATRCAKNKQVAIARNGKKQLQLAAWLQED